VNNDRILEKLRVVLLEFLQFNAHKLLLWDSELNKCACMHEYNLVIQPEGDCFSSWNNAYRMLRKMDITFFDSFSSNIGCVKTSYSVLSSEWNTMLFIYFGLEPEDKTRVRHNTPYHTYNIKLYIHWLLLFAIIIHLLRNYICVCSQNCMGYNRKWVALQEQARNKLVIHFNVEKADKNRIH
jgi:hypothetical protein